MSIRSFQSLRTLSLTGVLACCAATTRLSAAFVFNPSYTGGTLEQQNATTAALNSLASNFGNNVVLPLNITIGDLGNTGTLGSSSISLWQQIGGSGPFYPSPLYNILTATPPVAMTLSMNNNPSITWGYAAAAPGAGNYSWQSVVMHEALHSLGFYDGIDDATGAYAQGGPVIFDTFTTVGMNGTAFTSLADNAARAAAITGNNLFWNGPNGKAANGGNPVKLYSPGTFEAGSTYSHIDPSQTGVGGLLFPALDANTFYAGPTGVELGIMRDIGFAAVPEPAEYAWLSAGLCLAFAVWRRRHATA